jgi:hypothetical protein
MLTCKEITEQSDGYLAGDLGFYQKLQVRIHLMMCRYCRRYIRQLRLLVRTVRRLYGSTSSDQVDKIMRAVKNGIK